ncbi:MAG TPA: hypothetical protein EYO73_10035 [Sulfurimonas sp.]|nr:hypothetical protein [Sulfurimonas sp.]
MKVGIDILKIDGSLIGDTEKSKNTKNIVQRIKTLASKMGG